MTSNRDFWAVLPLFCQANLHISYTFRGVLRLIFNIIFSVIRAYLIIWGFTGLLVYMQHSSSPMIDIDSSAVFHIRFPRSHFLDFGPFLRPIRKMDELWMWNTTTNMTFSLWKTSFTKPCEIYIRLYISTRMRSSVLFRTYFAFLPVLFSLFQLDVILFPNLGRLPRF